MSVNYLQRQALNNQSIPSDGIFQPGGTKTLNDIANEAAKRYSGLKVADFLTSIDLFQEIICDYVLEGNEVRTDIANYLPSIESEYETKKKVPVQGSSQLKAMVSTGPRLEQKLQSLKTRPIEEPSPRPNPQHYEDQGSGTFMSRLRSGGIGILSGSSLKINVNRKEEGIFIVKVDGSETRVTTLLENTASRLIFKVPRLNAGLYTLEVRSLGKGDCLVKGMLDAQLEVI